CGSAPPHSPPAASAPRSSARWPTSSPRPSSAARRPTSTRCGRASRRSRTGSRSTRGSEVTAQILDGTATAAAIKSELAERVAALRERGIVPGLGTVLVGEDPGSLKYVAGKHRDCQEVGITSIREDLPASATQDEILAAVRRLNE